MERGRSLGRPQQRNGIDNGNADDWGGHDRDNDNTDGSVSASAFGAAPRLQPDPTSASRELAVMERD